MKKRMFAIAAMMAAVITLSSCAASPATNATGDTPASTAVSGTTASAGESSSSASEYIKISASEAKALMDAGNVTILDVRSQEEFDAGHIAGAIRLAYGEFPDKLASVLPDKDATILVYCRSGHRSKIASDMLIEAGYTHVMDFGGIIDWPYEVVK
jgi:phage shock protein E